MHYQNVKFVSVEAEFIYHSVELLRKETIKIKFIGCALYVNLFYQEKSIAFWARVLRFNDHIEDVTYDHFYVLKNFLHPEIKNR